MDTLRQALGLIEAWGHLPLITALDAAIKAAQVSLTSSHFVGGGLSTATVRGDVGAVKAALSAAQATFNQMGTRGMTHVIARPDSAVWAMLKKDGLKIDDEPLPPAASGGGKTVGGNISPSRPEGLNTAAVTAAQGPGWGEVAPKASPPALKAEAKVPALKAQAEAPAVKAETAPPAVKKKAEVPAARSEAAAPAIKDKPKKTADSKTEVIKGYDEYPPVKAKKGDRKAKKPRKK